MTDLLDTIDDVRQQLAAVTQRLVQLQGMNDNQLGLINQRDLVIEHVEKKLAASQARVKQLEEALERCLEDLRQWKRTYPRAASDSKDIALDNLSTNEVIELGERALIFPFTERPPA